MQSNYKRKIKATIIPLIVVLIYLVIIYIIVYIFFSDTISRAFGLIDIMSVEKSEEKKDIRMDEKLDSLVSYPEYGTQYGKIKIQSLDIELPLYYGDTLSILRNGVGHSSGSYFPGEGGSILCMAHNTSGMLKKLPEVKNGEKIVIETSYGTYMYEIYDTKIVKETDLEAAPIQKDKECLMLYTCYPVDAIGHTDKRFFVYANLI